MAGFPPGYWDQTTDNSQIKDQTMCRIPSQPPGLAWERSSFANYPGLSFPNQTRLRWAAPFQRQRSQMTLNEQLLSPEPGMKDDQVTEFVVFIFADAAMAVVDGIENLGFRELLKTLFKREEKDAAKAFDYFDPVAKNYPNSPYIDKLTDPKEIAERINTKIADGLKEAARSNRAAIENQKISRLHELYVRTGKWRFDGLDDWQFPDEGLQELRQQYLSKQLFRYKAP